MSPPYYESSSIKTKAVHGSAKCATTTAQNIYSFLGDV